VFNVPLKSTRDRAGNALIIKKNGTISMKEILPPQLKSMFFERIYFQEEAMPKYTRKKNARKTYFASRFKI
jgi:amidophosphoribosyltransferase